VLYQRATLANRLGRSSEAQAQLQQALDMCRSTGNLHQQILVLLQLSNTEHRMNGAKAQDYATEAIDLARANGLENLTTRGLIDLGNAYFVKGEDDEARKYFAQGLEYAGRCCRWEAWSCSGAKPARVCATWRRRWPGISAEDTRRRRPKR
jgi:tetratricopeptide (TPR) repeat protein